MKKSFLLLLLPLLLVACGGEPTYDHPDNFYEGKSITDDKIGEVVEAKLDSQSLHQFYADEELDTVLVNAMHEFYLQRDFRLAWNKPGDQLPRSEKLIEMLQTAEAQNLHHIDYDVEKLESLSEEVFADDEVRKNNKLINLDLLLTANYLVYAKYTLIGRLDPKELHNIWYLSPRDIDMAQSLSFAVETGKVEKALEALEPQFEQYHLLEEKLKKYQEIVDQGGWPTDIPEGPVIKPGENSSRIPKIRKRLALEQEIPKDIGNSTLYDEELVEAIKLFQVRMGMVEDAEIGDEIVARLNIPADYRMRQIKLNMERMRWLPDTLPEKYFLVNIPDYRLHIFEGEKEVMEMKVIVGKVMNSTPVFADEVEYVDFSPYWNVPNSIATQEILPNIKANPGYLAANHYQLLSGWGSDPAVIDPYTVRWDTITARNFPYRIRQLPGPWNALGRVKFMFPNDFSIYLHDTPADYLFKESKRNFSHGCIRVEKPVELAQYLLPELTVEEAKQLMNRRSPIARSLDEHIPIYILYWTAWVDAEGYLHFRDDLYSLDKESIMALREMEEQEAT